MKPLITDLWANGISSKVANMKHKMKIKCWSTGVEAILPVVVSEKGIVSLLYYGFLLEGEAVLFFCCKADVEVDAVPDVCCGSGIGAKHFQQTGKSHSKAVSTDGVHVLVLSQNRNAIIRKLGCCSRQKR